MQESEREAASGHVVRLEIHQGRRGVPTGLPVGTAEEALDRACDLYLNY
ncbi:hypothetical protein [Streptosporangium sp. NPDC049046]